MNLELAAAIRGDFAAVRDRWIEYLLSGGGSFHERPRAELEEAVGRGLEAWVRVLEGKEDALKEFVRDIVELRMRMGFSLAEIHRASIGFRIVAEPLIEQHAADPVAALRAYSDAAAVCDRATQLLSEEWPRLATAELAEVNRLEERRTQELLEEMVFARTREIQELGQRLVQRERLAAIGELAASIAHELRNPLGVIANASYLLRRKLGGASSDPQFAASATRMVETIETHIQRCSRVITDLLDFARSRPLRQETVDPGALLRNALREHLIPRHIRVVTEVDPALPPFLGDEPFLQQAVSNLIANALQAMAEHDHGELRLTCHAEAERVAIVVTDTGTGMTDEVRQHMFEPLFTTSPGGTGLGLPLVKRIIEAHDGGICVDSAPGAGTTITVSLPTRSTDQLTTETQRHRE